MNKKLFLSKANNLQVGISYKYLHHKNLWKHEKFPAIEHNL